MLPGPAVPGCCLVSFYFLWAIHSINSVILSRLRPRFTLITKTFKRIDLNHPSIERRKKPNLLFADCIFCWPGNECSTSVPNTVMSGYSDAL